MSGGQEQDTRSDKGIRDALYAKLDAIVKSQQQMRADFNSNFVRPEVRLAELIESKLSGLRQEMDTKLVTICDDLREVQQRMMVLELSAAVAATNGADAMEGAPAVQLAELRQWLDILEVATDDRSRDTLFVKGLVEAQGETL